MLFRSALWFLDASNNRTLALNVTQPKAVAVGSEGELVVSYTGTQLQNVVELIGNEVSINSARKPTRRLVLLRKLPFRITDAVTLPSCGHHQRHLRSQSRSRSFEAPQPLSARQQKRHAAHVASCFLLADLFSGFAAMCDPNDPRNICHTVVHSEEIPKSFAVSGIADGVSDNEAAEAAEGAASVPYGLRQWGDTHLLVAEGTGVRVCRPSFCQLQSDRRPIIDFEGSNGILYMRAFLLPATYS